MGKVAKVPQVMQMEALECGAACLTMILAYYGKWVPLEKVRADCGVSRDGSKAANILKAARSYGLSAKGFVYSTEALRRQGKLPCIVFWNFKHFVVVDGFKGKHVVLNDPARGIVKVTIDEFDESFTGVALMLEPTEAFEPGGHKPDTFAYARKRLRGLGFAVGFVMITAVIVSAAGIINTSLGRVLLDNVIGKPHSGWLYLLLFVMLGLAIITGIVSILQAVYLMRIQGKIAVVSSSRFMRHLLHLPMGFYSQRMVGDLQQRQLANEVIALQLMSQLAPVIINMIMLVLYLVIMLHFSVVLTIVGVCTVLLNAVVARYISKKRVNIARAFAASGGKLYASTVSGIEMIETIKAAGAEVGFFGRWAGFQAEANDANVRMSYLNEYMGVVPVVLTDIANIAVLSLGIMLIVQGEFTPGALLSFTGFLTAFMTPVGQIIVLGQTVQEMETQMERVEDVMRYDVDVPEDLEEVVDAEALDRAKLRGDVDLDGISFGYSPLEPPLIENFDLHVKAGQWVALVGGSGCGKSTLAKILSGLYEPWEGEVRFDGTPVADIPRAVLRGSLAVVDQDIVAFDDTVSNNVRLWDNSIEDYEVVLACRDASIHDVIMDRPGDYSSNILPGGRNFSGGQLQRLEIARVLALDPTVVILDEATSALDSLTERQVMQRIRDRGITCVVVAHRLSTIRVCDEIIVLDDGKVVERGTHDELIAKGGAYCELVRSD